MISAWVAQLTRIEIYGGYVYFGLFIFRCRDFIFFSSFYEPFGVLALTASFSIRLHSA